MTFPTTLTNAVDGVTEIVAAHLNNVEAKIGITGSTVNTSLDYKVCSSSSLDPGHLHSKKSGDIVQMVYTMVSAYSTGSNTIPLDDTIPQISEGTEFMTLSITPTNVNNLLDIEVVFFCIQNPSAGLIVALFQGTGPNALSTIEVSLLANYGITVPMRYVMVAGTTSPTTFRVRAGPHAGGNTIYFNGSTGGRLFGGTSGSSITIKEIKV